MEHQDREVQYRCAKWLITNMLHSNEITIKEYEEIHKQLLTEFDPPLKSIETPGFYVQEVSEDE